MHLKSSLAHNSHHYSRLATLIVTYVAGKWPTHANSSRSGRWTTELKQALRPLHPDRMSLHFKQPSHQQRINSPPQSQTRGLSLSAHRDPLHQNKHHQQRLFSVHGKCLRSFRVYCSLPPHRVAYRARSAGFGCHVFSNGHSLDNFTSRHQIIK